MSEQFHPTPDWSGTLPDPAAIVDLRAARRDAFERTIVDFPVAARLYSIRQALESAPVDQVLRQIMACVLAVDCWIARLPCPRNGCRGKAWAQYFDMRAGAMRQALSDGLTRSTVLERIPVRWIPHHQVSAQLGAVAAGAGFSMEGLEMELIPPIPGGHEWVARECGEAIAKLSARAQNGPVAAILHWPDRTSVAVVVKIQGQLKAFGIALEPDGTALDVAKLTGATLIPAMVPPLSLVRRWIQALGLHWFVWRRVRQWRLLFGANPLAST